MPRLAESWGRVLPLACLAALCGGTILLAQTQWSETPTGGSAPLDPLRQRGGEAAPAAEPERLREGMQLVDALGHFEMLVEGPLFVDQAGRRLAGLENLNLQRIARHLRGADMASNVQWKISGTVTEYEGRNFILIERAVYQPPRS